MSYLDSMFAKLPQTQELERIKQGLLDNMQDKYEELLAEGKSEHEAIGIVIAEFGNVDELIEELDLPIYQEQGEEGVSFSDQEIEEFQVANRKTGQLIGIGVMLIITGAGLLMLFNAIGERGLNVANLANLSDVLGLIPLFLFVAIAVGLFIYSGTIIERFDQINQPIALTTNQRKRLEQAYGRFQPIFTKVIITGVIFCILAPLQLILLSSLNDDLSSYGVAILLFIVAIAVYLFIYYGKIHESYRKLLGIGISSEREIKERDRVIGAVAVGVWSLATVIFLISGLVYRQWHINWIIFPVTGILFGGFSGVYSALKKE